MKRCVVLCMVLLSAAYAGIALTSYAADGSSQQLEAAIEYGMVDNIANSYMESPWYGGMSVSYFVSSIGDYDSLWHNMPGTLDAQWAQDFIMEPDYGVGVHIDLGKSMYDHQLNVGLRAVYANTSSIARHRDAALETSLLGALISFEYMWRSDYCVAPYINMGMGAFYTTSAGRYSRLPALSNSIDGNDFNNYITGGFKNLSEWSPAYDLGVGLHFLSSDQLSLRIGYHVVGTADFDGTNNIRGTEVVTTNYDISSAYGSATYSSNKTSPPVSIKGAMIQGGTIEIGVRYWFA